MEAINENQGFRWITFPELNRFPDLEHGFSLRPFPSQNFNSRELLSLLKKHTLLHSRSLARTGQVHSSTVTITRTGGNFSRVDGLLTREKGLALTAFSGDCLLIYLFDPVQKAIGLVHAGRRGTEKKIAREALGRMISDLGARAGDCIAVLSPRIGPCCYEIDLSRGNASQLAELGLNKIFSDPACTCCHPELFYSYRRGERNDRMVGWLALI